MASPVWRIYYADGSVVQGKTAKEWRAAPDNGVQVVVRFKRNVPLRWHYSGGPVRDRELWTGTDTYNPFGWEEKRGCLIEDAKYWAIWERACGDSVP